MDSEMCCFLGSTFSIKLTLFLLLLGLFWPVVPSKWYPLIKLQPKLHVEYKYISIPGMRKLLLRRC